MLFFLKCFDFRGGFIEVIFIVKFDFYFGEVGIMGVGDVV